MNEAPPTPVSDSFNVSQWNATDTGTSATQSWVKLNFLSRVITDTAANLISFANGIRTNLVTAFSGNVLTIGEGGGTKSVSLYYPTLAVAILDPADNTGRIPSTSWIQSWFANIVNTNNLSWALVQTFTLGILTNSIKCTTTSGTLSINSVDSATGGIIIGGGPSQTTGITIGNNNGTTINKIDIGSVNKNLTLNGSNIDVAGPLRPYYSYTAAGTGTGRLGQIISATYSMATVPTGVSTSVGSLDLTEGIWILIGNFTLAIPSGAATFTQTSWNLSSTQYAVTDYSSFTANPRSYSSSTTLYVSASGTYLFKCLIYYSGANATTNSTAYNVSAIRIA